MSLGTSYGQRLRRVAEVTVGVALGVFGADLLVRVLGTEGWVIVLVVGLSMSVALLLDNGQVFLIQAAVQSIIITALAPAPGQAFTRWTDALIGGGVALVAATVVPAAPLRRPREQAAKVVRKVRDLLQAAERGDGRRRRRAGDGAARGGPRDRSADPRAPGRRRRGPGRGRVVAVPHPARPGLRKMAELVEPLDRALRSTRVLVRQCAVAAYRRQPVPHSYAVVTAELAAAVEVVATRARRRPDGDRRRSRR